MTLARANGADFSRVVTIGRQTLVGGGEMELFFRQRGRDDIAERIMAEVGDGYCESLLRTAFEAQTVHSIDASDYENASIVHDMNTPIGAHEAYSVVLDLGTLEHIFNVPVALDNVAALCAPGGTIMHMLPSNNCSGHGFYQFSPELFFQVYSETRGYSGTRVFAVPMGSQNIWYEVRAPHMLKARVNITSREELYLMVITRKTGAPLPLVQHPVQQSDYTVLWSADKAAPKAPRRRNAFQHWIWSRTNSMRHRAKMGRRDATSPRADMVRRSVLELAPRFDVSG